jgi:precorrin-3B methylase
VVVGYRPYLELIEDLTVGKSCSSGMRRDRALPQALKRAAAGATVALVSSGRPGVSGWRARGGTGGGRGFDVDIEIVPGFSAAGPRPRWAPR